MSEKEKKFNQSEGKKSKPEELKVTESQNDAELLSSEELLKIKEEDEKYKTEEIAKAKEDLDNIFDEKKDKTSFKNESLEIGEAVSEKILDERRIKKEKGEESDNPEKINQKELEQLKKGFDELSESIKKLALEFTKRDNKDLNPLITTKNIGGIKTSASSLESVMSEKTIQGEYLMGNISKIIEAIDKIGDIDRSRATVKEDMDSLKKVSFLLGQIQEICVEILSTVRNIEKEEAKDIAKSINKLRKHLSDKENYISRLINAFNRYYGK